MGRHRRSDAGRAATGRATDSTAGSYAGHDDTYEAGQTGAYGGAHEERYAGGGFAGPYGTGPRGSANGDPGWAFDEAYPGEPQAAYAPSGSPGSSSHRRRKRAARPVRTGLLGVSAAVAMGAVAVATGVVPGMDNYSLGGGDGADKVRAADSPSGLQTQGGTDGSADRAPTSASRSAERSDSPSASPSRSSSKPSSTPSKTASPSKSSGSGGTATSPRTATPSKTATTKPTPPVTAPSLKAPSGEASAEAQVLALVNTERAKVGCSPVTADSGLASLAGNFSEDMAARGFFDHTDPDGATPWDRAKKAGITDLGGENIARGQANAQSVMDSWMNSPGHRANILNCDYKTLGVGVHFGSGGPWWTQDFGF
ncbi:MULTISPECIES: CAP domain-containing protein [Streptomyces]|uniref:CAP domain-containing protein n=1 Tax=Streptomyces TaxID=1883 RepID=UPI001D0BA264|nr:MULTISPECIES: CAP domain-containing protein [Streptomyces]MCX5086650.1 CAP domain-containing protein [Streptomyces sp. NBC_00401]UDM02311.1 CAP domain-containing protein [Streptomyces longhuiensis]